MDNKIPEGNAELGAPPLDVYDPAEPVFSPLVMDERDRLNVIFKDPVFVKAFRNLRTMKPSVFIATPTMLAGAGGAQLANNRFHEIRGWEMFVAALLNQGKEPVVKKRTVLEEYPSSGTIEGEAQRAGGSVAPRAIPGSPVNPISSKIRKP